MSFSRIPTSRGNMTLDNKPLSTVPTSSSASVSSSRPIFVVSKPGTNSSRIPISKPARQSIRPNNAKQTTQNTQIAFASVNSSNDDKENQDVKAMIEEAYRRGLEAGRVEAESQSIILSDSSSPSQSVTHESSDRSAEANAAQHREDHAVIDPLLDESDIAQNISHIPLSPVKKTTNNSPESPCATSASLMLLNTAAPVTPLRSKASPFRTEDDDDCCFATPNAAAANGSASQFESPVQGQARRKLAPFALARVQECEQTTLSNALEEAAAAVEQAASSGSLLYSIQNSELEKTRNSSSVPKIGSKENNRSKASNKYKALDEHPYDPNGKTFSYKVLVVGNAKCGKTSIISRFARNSFEETYNTTIGADYARRVINQADGNRVQMQLWDLAGQDRFAKLTRAYFRGARAAVVVCDITRAETQHAVREWKREIDEQFELNDDTKRKNFPVILLMNKSDLLDKSIDELLRMGQELERLKSELGFTGAFTTSAKESRFVGEAFDHIVQALYKQESAKENNIDDIDTLLKSLDDSVVESQSTDDHSPTEPAASSNETTGIVDLSNVSFAVPSVSCCTGGK